MAQEFLNQLPRVGRGVLTKEDQRCPICMEDYGTTPSANGTIERPVRLPCTHILGSECIATWVSSPAQGGSGRNTCPVCRHVLIRPRSRFPSSSSSSRIQSSPMAPWRVEHMRIHAVLQNWCESIRIQLRLGDDIVRLAKLVADRHHDRVSGISDYRRAIAVAAASIYLASEYLGGGTRVDVIANCVDDDISVGMIMSAYSSLQPTVRSLDLQRLARGEVEGEQRR